MNWRVFTAILLLPVVAAAQVPSPDPPIEAIPPGEDVLEPIRKGQVAPFDGQLFDTFTALRWANWLQQYKYRLVWDVDKERKTCTVEVKYRDDLLVAEEERAKRVEGDLEARLVLAEQARSAAEEAARNPAWYATPAFGVVIGVVATAAIFGIAVAALDATR